MVSDRRPRYQLALCSRRAYSELRARVPEIRSYPKVGKRYFPYKRPGVAALPCRSTHFDRVCYARRVGSRNLLGEKLENMASVSLSVVQDSFCS